MLSCHLNKQDLTIYTALEKQSSLYNTVYDEILSGNLFWRFAGLTNFSASANIKSAVNLATGKC